MQTKICNSCKKEKSLGEFHKNKSNKDGRQTHCKKCRNTYAKQPYVQKQRSRQGHKGHLKHRYNMTLEQYDKMFKKQDGVCAMCGGINLDGRRLTVDHNHKTGKIRELLCAKCNSRLGVVENTKWLQLAKNYLKKHATN